MKKLTVLVLISALVACSASFTRQGALVPYTSHLKTYEDTLYFLYSQPPSRWPAPFIDSGIAWTELGIVPGSPLKNQTEELKHRVELGKILFFDPRLSSSKKISCASCHVPSLSWTDGRAKSLGHDDQQNKRNSPTILNTWAYKHLFWDGRSHSLADQAFSPINSESEMHSSMADVSRTLRRIEGYRELFQKAFGSPEISPETVTEAIATFEKTLVSEEAAFDRFLKGDTMALSKPAIRGLHLFRTRARCMNCHNGPLLTDNSFHNVGLSHYGGQGEDVGRYFVTHQPEDMGRFRTPSLRDVMRTGPWMHNGLFDNMEVILDLYNAGMPQPAPASSQLNDPLFPKADPLLRKLNLTREERRDIIAFLQAITAEPAEVKLPAMPQ